MARLTVYIPDKLKAEMDATDVGSWSAVAVEAFRQKLAHLAIESRTRTPTETIHKLRAAVAAVEAALKQCERRGNGKA